MLRQFSISLGRGLALVAILSLSTGGIALGQAGSGLTQDWHGSDDRVLPSASQIDSGVITASAEAPIRGAARPAARATAGSGSLPNKHGQLWREYDIRPYTARVTSTARPEQAIVDWILRDTGYEVWHGEPLAILSATEQALRIYHTPDMQAHVAEVVDRFVQSKAQTEVFSLRVVTVNHPNWRTQAMPLLRPVPVQAPGVRAWLLQKEDSARVLAELRRRSDFREHSTPHLMVENGQPAIVSATRARGFVQAVQTREDAWPGYISETGMLDEGFSLEFTPLLSLDRKVIEATVKCDIDQVEKIVPVTINVPTVADPRNHTKVDVPQVSQFRFHERFRWPADQVLLIGMGMVPLPVPAEGRGTIGGIRIPFADSPPRADVLVFIESRPRDMAPVDITRSAGPGSTSGTGRY